VYLVLSGNQLSEFNLWSLLIVRVTWELCGVSGLCVIALFGLVVISQRIPREMHVFPRLAGIPRSVACLNFPLLLSDFTYSSNMSTNLGKTSQYGVSWKSVPWSCSYMLIDRCIDRWTDIKKLMELFCNTWLQTYLNICVWNVFV
jgi:hypothetical protein